MWSQLRLLPAIFILSICYASAAFSAASGVILGSVHDTETQTPVTGANITALNQTDGSSYNAVTGADGIFFLAPLAPGFYRVSAGHGDFQTSSVDNYPVRISDTAAEPLRIELTRVGSSTPRTAPAERSFQPAPPPPVSAIQMSQEVHIRWTGDAPRQLVQSLRQIGNFFDLVERRQISGPVPRQRMPRLSSNQILVTIVDEQGAQRDWVIIPDPRIIRAEHPDSDGELSGEIIYRFDADFSIALPAVPSAALLKFYHPRWTGRDFSLELLGELDIR